MIKFLDLHSVNNRFRKEFNEVFNSTLDVAHFISGSNVTTFENEFANYCGSKYCIGTGNGLDALTLILKGYIELGKLKKGDKIIVPANTFIATILSVLHADLQPVLVEPDANTYNISEESLKSHLNDEIKGVIVVHLYGQLGPVAEIKEFTNNLDLLIIEDAAQAHGAVSKYGKAGSLADAAAFSFYPSKNLGALGDGGAITTNDEDLYNTIQLLHNYGSKEKYENELIGYNSRLDDMQAAFLSVKLKVLDADNNRRREIAELYLKGIYNNRLNLPKFDGTKNHVFYAFVIEVDDRISFIEHLKSNKIEWLIHYPIPPHKQNALKEFSELKLPITEQIHKRIISLPISPVMTDEEVQTLIELLNTY